MSDVPFVCTSFTQYFTVFLFYSEIDNLSLEKCQKKEKEIHNALDRLVFLLKEGGKNEFSAAIIS